MTGIHYDLIDGGKRGLFLPDYAMTAEKRQDTAAALRAMAENAEKPAAG